MAPGTKRTTPLHDHSSELAHCSVDKRFELLGQTQFFMHLSEEQLGDVNERFQEVHFAQDEWLYHVGDPAQHMYIVVAGQVKLLQQGAEGKEVLLHIAASGDLIGGLAIFGNTTYSYAAQAHTGCCVLRIASSDFQQLLQLHPSITMKVLEFAGTQLEDARDKVRTLSADPVEQRIAKTLLQLAERHGETKNGETVIQIPLPQQDLAAMTGTTVETVSRILTQFRKRGIIRSGRRWVAIANIAELEDISYL